MPRMLPRFPDREAAHGSRPSLVVNDPFTVRAESAGNSKKVDVLEAIVRV